MKGTNERIIQNLHKSALRHALQELTKNKQLAALMTVDIKTTKGVFSLVGSISSEVAPWSAVQSKVVRTTPNTGSGQREKVYRRKAWNNAIKEDHPKQNKFSKHITKSKKTKTAKG